MLGCTRREAASFLILSIYTLFAPIGRPGSPATRRREKKARQKEALEYDLIRQKSADETLLASGVEQKILREARPDKVY